MKNTIGIILVLYVILFIAYSCQHEERLAENNMESNIHPMTHIPNQAVAQDSIQNRQENQKNVVLGTTLSNDNHDGDLFIGHK